MNFKFQISNFKFLLVVLVGLAVGSCSFLGGDKEPLYQLSDLQGLWVENGTEHYVRFTTEKSDETDYLYGYEWDEADEVMEEDVLQDVHGNGWFKYWFETTNGGLHELHLMTNGGAVIPKEYIVSKLTDTELEYYEKDNKNWKYSFTRVVTVR